MNIFNQIIHDLVISEHYNRTNKKFVLNPTSWFTIADFPCKQKWQCHVCPLVVHWATISVDVEDSGNTAELY